MTDQIDYVALEGLPEPEPYEARDLETEFVSAATAAEAFSILREACPWQAWTIILRNCQSCSTFRADRFSVIAIQWKDGTIIAADFGGNQKPVFGLPLGHSGKIIALIPTSSE